MKAEQLLVLASARGINLDLRRPRSDIPLAHRSTPRRRDVIAATEGNVGHPGIPGVLSADGEQSTSSRAPDWTSADLGFAAVGMPDRPWRTLCWAIALEQPARAYLKWQLLEIAVAAKEHDRWPDRVKRTTCAMEVAPGVRCGLLRCQDHYVEDLCELAVIGIAEPHVLSSEAQRARVFGVAQNTWDRHFAVPYQQLASHLSSWFGGAIGYINSHLEEAENARGAA